MRLGDQLHDLRQHRRRTDFLRPDHQAASAVEGRADYAGAEGLLDRDGFPGQHRLVDMRASLDHFAVHRHLFAGAHPQAIADVDVAEFDILLAAIVALAARGLWRQPQQGFQGSRGLRAGTQFEQLAEQGQRDDYCGGFEIDTRAAMFVKRLREQVWCDGGDDAVAECRANADADQGPHVGAQVADRLHAANEERPACPQHDWHGQYQFDPGSGVHRQPR